MKIAFILFNGITFLDFVGFYDVITRLQYFESTKDSTWEICALQEEITDELGMTVKANKINPDLSTYDIVFVPGGFGTRELRWNYLSPIVQKLFKLGLYMMEKSLRAGESLLR
ncbi:type 1 glutamine amidotransferase family protein [Paenibacillus selenitireducens]|uniref:hypothetical protein n=1 Tax=Paenibacillus selenitireducens TaxID=1324314 RepID=UPI0026BB9E3A